MLSPTTMGMAPPRILLTLAASGALLLAAASPALAAGPIKSGLAPVSTTSLKPGVTLSTYRMTVADGGIYRSINVYKVAWRVGHSHVRLHSGVLGAYYRDDYSIRLNRISSFASTPAANGLVAAINGDFFADSDAHWYAGHPSGLLVQGRSVLAFGWGGPSVGYRPAGDLVFGRPQVVPSLIALGGQKTATVGAFNSLSTDGDAIRSDQIAVYTTAGSKVAVPSGYVAYVLPSTVLAKLLHGSKRGYRYASGANMPERVAAFRFEDPKAAYRTAAVPTSKPAACPTGTCPAGTSLTVPHGGVVAIAKAGGVAAKGMSEKASQGLAFSVAVDDAGWDTVQDAMGGKPQLVTSGVALARRPTFVDPWQWDNPHWRPAVVRSSDGTAWIAIAGGGNGVGILAPTWARMLVQMGAREAIGFDNNSSTELFRRGAGPITAYGFERSIPTATFLSYF
jgi:hypothetical protein